MRRRQHVRGGAADAGGTDLPDLRETTLSLWDDEATPPSSTPRAELAKKRISRGVEGALASEVETVEIVAVDQLDEL
jgi:hypothetical protein